MSFATIVWRVDKFGVLISGSGDLKCYSAGVYVTQEAHAISYNVVDEAAAGILCFANCKRSSGFSFAGFVMRYARKATNLTLSDLFTTILRKDRRPSLLSRIHVWRAPSMPPQ